MAQNKNTRNFDVNVINETRNQMKKQMREGQIWHDHRDSRGQHGTLEPVKTAKGFIENRNNYTDMDVICTECKDIFSMESYTQDDAEAALYVLYSICNQIKVVDKIEDDAEYEKLVNSIKLLDQFKYGIIPYYLKMIKSLSKDNGNRDKKNSNRKGHIGAGINAQQFNTR